MHTLRKTSATLALTAMAAALSGCFGGGGTDPLPTQPDMSVPASATTSTDAFVNYTAGLAPDDTAQPLLVGGVMPPTSETAEPVDI